MAGLFEGLFKSQAQIEAESKRYYEWAYPYGEKQKQKLDDLIHEFITDEDPRFAIYNYLVCKQELVPMNLQDKHPLTADDFLLAKKNLKKQYNKKARKDMAKYMAIVEADLFIDENLNYCDIQELQEKAFRIQEIID